MFEIIFLKKNITTTVTETFDLYCIHTTVESI